MTVYYFGRQRTNEEKSSAPETGIILWPRPDPTRLNDCQKHIIVVMTRQMILWCIVSVMFTRLCGLRRGKKNVVVKKCNYRRSKNAKHCALGFPSGSVGDEKKNCKIKSSRSVCFLSHSSNRGRHRSTYHPLWAVAPTPPRREFNF